MSQSGTTWDPTFLLRENLNLEDCQMRSKYAKGISKKINCDRVVFFELSVDIVLANVLPLMKLKGIVAQRID